MFDAQEAIRVLTAQLAAMQQLLFDKGVLSPDEFDRAAMKWTARVDQVVAERHEEVLKANPGLKPWDGFLFLE